MRIITNPTDIDPQQWRELSISSPTSSFFQSHEAFTFSVHICFVYPHFMLNSTAHIFLTSGCFQNWFASYSQDTKITVRVFQKLQFLHFAGKGQYGN